MQRTDIERVLKGLKEGVLLDFAQAHDEALCMEDKVLPILKANFRECLIEAGAKKEDTAEIIEFVENGVEADGYEWVWDEELAR